MKSDERRLIEDFLPIQAVSAEASREKSIRKGHISTLHIWWARRPLVACRAAVYGALVPASRFVPENGPENKKQSLGRANAAKFVENLCKYPGDPRHIEQARRHILEAHAERLTEETGKKVTAEDIEAGRAPRPMVLDMFAGGGAIPLEALRLGCEAFALDLNPVAHIIELCTLVYPQKYGKPDPNARGITGPVNAKGESTWGGLADEIRHWGQWVLEKVKAEIGDLYPLIPVPQFQATEADPGFQPVQHGLFKSGQKPVPPDTATPGHLTPIAYLWTRTVRCKNPACGATVPLVRQTWLCKKKNRYVALKMVAQTSSPSAPRQDPGAPTKQVRFEVVESPTENGLGFDPAAFSKGGNAACPFCGTVADSGHVKAEGRAGRLGTQLMAVVCIRFGKPGKIYLSAEQALRRLESAGWMPVPPEEEIRKRIEELCLRTGLTAPNEPLVEKLTDQLPNYGMNTLADLFTPRQMLCLLTFTAAVRKALGEMECAGVESERAKAMGTYLGLLVDRLAHYNSTLCRWVPTGEKIAGPFGRQALPMVWDFAELAPFGEASGSPHGALDWIVGVVEAESDAGFPATVLRGSATALPWNGGAGFQPGRFDAVITDPPYYDNIQYAALSDFFYVWLKRTVGHLYPEHFSAEVSPRKSEAVASPWRHKNKDEARKFYERMMARAFEEANRVLKPGGSMVVVYGHKTTLGWSTLVDALRGAGFIVTEAWPLDTEMPSRLLAHESAALASSIFLVARKRGGASTGSYEDEVRPDLERVVRERVDTLWKMGITGADLVIAAVGAGLRTFTRFARVEYANGEEVPSVKFLAEVEGVVLEALLEKIFGLTGSGVAAVDGASRFYVIWRYTYGTAETDAGEAIVFTYGHNVELDGPNGLSSGSRALVEKKKGEYRLRDFAERGDDERLGMPRDDGKPAPVIDILHRILWLVENQPRNLARFLNDAQPDRERLRLVAQALAGTALEGSQTGSQSHQRPITTPAEAAALKKLVANWRALIDQRLASREGTLFEPKQNSED